MTAILETSSRPTSTSGPGRCWISAKGAFLGFGIVFSFFGGGHAGPGGLLQVGEEVDGLRGEAAGCLDELGGDHVEVVARELLPWLEQTASTSPPPFGHRGKARRRSRLGCPS